MITRLTLRLLLALMIVASAAAKDSPTAKPPSEDSSAPAATDPSYHLSPGDTVDITVFNEPDLAITQTLGRSGEVRPSLIGEITLGGKTVREAEHALESTYRSKQFLKEPVVTLTVTSYFPREVSVLGAVRTPGTVVFPRDTTSLDIVAIITRVGGFLPVAKSDSVTITRRQADGKETVITVDLDNIISGRRKAGRDRADLAIYPGDRVWVPERLF